jgi:hypothetical protein
MDTTRTVTHTLLEAPMAATEVDRIVDCLGSHPIDYCFAFLDFVTTAMILLEQKSQSLI